MCFHVTDNSVRVKGFGIQTLASGIMMSALPDTIGSEFHIL
jgi:hypothetical protein